MIRRDYRGRKGPPALPSPTEKGGEKQCRSYRVDARRFMCVSPCISTEHADPPGRRGVWYAVGSACSKESLTLPGDKVCFTQGQAGSSPLCLEEIVKRATTKRISISTFKIQYIM